MASEAVEREFESWLCRSLTGFYEPGYKAEIHCASHHRAVFETICELTMDSKTKTAFLKHKQVELIPQDTLETEKYPDVVLKAGKRIHVLELKYHAEQDLGQFRSYLIGYEQQGFTTTISAIVDRRYKSTTWKRLVYPYIDELLTRRVTWTELLDSLKKRLGKHGLVLQLEALSKKYPFFRGDDAPPKKNRSRNLKLLYDEPYCFKRFFDDVLKQITPEVSYGHQAGNAPAGLRLGDPRWANWFDDGFSARVFLSWDLNERDRRAFLVRAGLTPPEEAFFTYTIIVYHKSDCFLRHQSHAKFKQAIKTLDGMGLHIAHNEPGCWHRTIPAKINRLATGDNRIYFVNAHCLDRWILPFSEAERLGWKSTVEALADNYLDVSSTLDAVCQNR